LKDKLDEITERLKKVGVRVFHDHADNKSPGWKYNYWELKGVPIRIEFGAKELTEGKVCIARRDTGEKITLDQAGLETEIPNLLTRI